MTEYDGEGTYGEIAVFIFLLGAIGFFMGSGIGYWIGL